MNPAPPSSKKPHSFRAPVLMYLTIVVVFAILAVYVLHRALKVGQ
jgi:hypothetical protein